MKLDLHLHTTASDGSLSPSALTWAAHAGGLDVIAITDHDTCAGVKEALSSKPEQLHVIPGVELSTTLDGNELHILGYFVNHEYPALTDHARTAAEKRAGRVRQMLMMLRDYNINIAYDEVAAGVDPGKGVLGRPHIARALQRKGHVQTIAEAFDRFLGDDRPCFLPTDLLHPRDAIQLIHDAGGVSIWAHPYPALFDATIPRLTEWGIKGLECVRPRATSSEIQFLEEHAKLRKMLISGGSDWHGTWHGRLGDFFVRADEVDELLQAGGM